MRITIIKVMILKIHLQIFNGEVIWWINWKILCMSVCWVASVMSDSFNPMDYSPPGTSLHGISQARILEWVEISFSRGSFPPWDRNCVSYFLNWRLVSLPLASPGKLLKNLPLKSHKKSCNNFVWCRINWIGIKIFYFWCFLKNAIIYIMILFISIRFV